MQRYFAALTLTLLVVMVWTRILMMRRMDIKTVHFGSLDKKDFLIPPFALFYFYLVFAATFSLPTITTQRFFQSEALSWLGALSCLTGLLLLLLSLISFGKSFRVGIDASGPGKLTTSGIFAISRNPIYVAFWLVILGQFLVFPNWIFLIYLAAATWLFHRQVLREEDYLSKHYGRQFSDYSHRVRRYL